MVDRAAGVVLWSANLGWRDVPLRDLIGADLDLPVLLEHDATAAALAEREAIGTDLLFVALGTGIGAAYVVDGDQPRGHRPGRRARPRPVGSDGEPCACGQTGCLEAYASAAVDRAPLRRAGRSRPVHVSRCRYRQGNDPVAAAVWQDAVDALGQALATATVLLDPAAIVLGGGLASAGEALVAPVTAALAAHLTWAHRTTGPGGALGSDAGVRGAGLVARAGAPRLAPTALPTTRPTARPTALPTATGDEHDGPEWRSGHSTGAPTPPGWR